MGVAVKYKALPNRIQLVRVIGNNHGVFPCTTVDNSRPTELFNEDDVIAIPGDNFHTNR